MSGADTDTQPRGVCRACGRSYTLRGDGTVRRHFAAVGFCPGSHRAPKTSPPPVPVVPDLAFIREGLPRRSDRAAYLTHALRFFEDVLAYAELLESRRGR